MKNLNTQNSLSKILAVGALICFAPLAIASGSFGGGMKKPSASEDMENKQMQEDDMNHKSMEHEGMEHESMDNET